MMRDALHRWIRAFACIAPLLAIACGLPVKGLGPKSPPVEIGLFSKLPVFTKVDSLTPELSWYPLSDEDLLSPPTDVTYELRIWKTQGGSSGELVYLRRALVETHHRLEVPLEPASTYLWSVRASFTLDGRRQVTEWAGAGQLLQDQTVPNASGFRFQTPAAN